MKLKEKMANAKAYVQKNQKKFILMMCSIVIVGGMVAGTLAWLSARTNPVINNFIGSNLEINLVEEAKDFQMIPSLEIPKDPVVTVEANSEACWLFLQVKESDAQANGSGIEVTEFDNSKIREGTLYKYLSYAMKSDWNVIDPVDAESYGLPVKNSKGVIVNTYYYLTVGDEGTALDAPQDFEILEGNKVTVNNWIINEELSESQLTANPVKITFTPIAIQRLGFPSVASAASQIAGEFE